MLPSEIGRFFGSSDVCAVVYLLSPSSLNGRQLNIVQAKHSVFWERSDSVVSGIFMWIRDTGVIIEEDMDEASTRGY